MLAGGLSVGDQVVSTTAWSTSTGSLAVGDVGTVKGPCSNPSADRAEPEPEPESPIAEAIARAAPPAGAIPALAIQTKMGNTLDCHTSLIAPALRLLQQEARGADWRANLGPYFEQSLAQHTATGAAGPSHNNDGRVGLRVWNLTDHRLRIRFCLEDGVENADAREIPPSSVESPIGPPDVPNWAFGTLTDAGQIVKISAKGAPEVEYLVCAEPSQHVFVVSHYELPALTFDRVGAASYAIQGGGAETSTDGDPRDCLAMSAGHVMATGRHSAVFTIVRTGPVTRRAAAGPLQHERIDGGGVHTALASLPRRAHRPAIKPACLTAHTRAQLWFKL